MNDWGHDNPHPLSQIKTELIWEGKYDEYGNRRQVEVAGADLPLQKIEAIDEPRSHAAGEGKQQLLAFEKENTRLDDFRNMLIWGDNKLVMASLLKDFKGQIDLIYIDPPYDVGSDFTCDVLIGDLDETLLKDQSVLEQVAYSDTWGRGISSYLQMISERLFLMRDLLSEHGTIFVHCDWHVGHYIRGILDEIFGKDNFLNEVVWYYYNKLHDSRKRILPRAHDVIFRYTKTLTKQIHNPLKEKRDKPVTKLKYKKVNGQIQNIIGEDGKVVTYTSEDKTVDDVWRIRCLQPANKKEYTRFKTQKPLDLIQRIINLASYEDSIIMDVFCGTGTTLAAAESLGRKWIGCDLGRFPIHTARKRMIELQRELFEGGKSYRAFDVYNLGRYERQWWQKERLQGADEEHRKIVLAFYRAEELTGSASPYLHGRKGPAFVYVDGIDSILELSELKNVAEATAAAGSKEVHCLAWEFEMELKRNAQALETEYGVKIRLIRIPREVMEKNRRPGVDEVPFFEMATLEAETLIKIEGGERIVDVKLTNFLPSLSEVPSKELEALKERALKSGFDFIDFWAVDFDHQNGQPFKHHWQDYRLRKDRSLKIQSNCKYTYTDANTHKICVKVIDTFGCDTSILLEVPGAKGK
jgi:adenine-specific DNA-methyltransferase